MIAFAHAGCATDIALVREIQEKTEAAGLAWAELQSRYLGFLVNSLRGRNQRWAEEVAHDTLANLWENAGKFTGGNVRAWLLVSAKNALVDKMRRGESRFERGFECELWRGEASVSFEPEAECTDGHVDTADFVARMMSVLDESDRELFVRYHVDGASVAELAAEMEASEAHVYRALRSIRESLRKWAAVNQGIEEYVA